MTYMDAVLANPTITGVPLNLVELAFVNRGVNSSDDYDVTGLESLELVTADIYLLIVTQPEIREGELTLKYNVSQLLGRARTIYSRYEDPKLEEAQPRKINLNITKQ